MTPAVMVGITLRLQPDAHLAAGQAAAARGQTLTAWIRQAIEEKITRDKRAAGQ
jgi:predicted HicB family RNase H-like nuclease